MVLVGNVVSTDWGRSFSRKSYEISLVHVQTSWGYHELFGVLGMVVLGLSFLFLFSLTGSRASQSWQVRAPAGPIWPSNPYMSWWLPCDSPAECWLQHALGRNVGMTSLIRIDGENYRLFGPECTADVPALPQVGLPFLSLTTTKYVFQGRGVQVLFCPDSHSYSRCLSVVSLSVCMSASLMLCVSVSLCLVSL